jgi:hypothetical protein
MVTEWLRVFDFGEPSLVSAWFPMVIYALGGVFVVLVLEFVRREVWCKLFHPRKKRKVWHLNRYAKPKL